MYYDQIWNKKEHIIMSRVFYSHVGLIYIETPCISFVIKYYIAETP